MPDTIQTLGKWWSGVHVSDYFTLALDWTESTISPSLLSRKSHLSPHSLGTEWLQTADHVSQELSCPTWQHHQVLCCHLPWMLNICPSFSAAPRTLHKVLTILSALASDRKGLESINAFFPEDKERRHMAEEHPYQQAHLLRCSVRPHSIGGLPFPTEVKPGWHSVPSLQQRGTVWSCTGILVTPLPLLAWQSTAASHSLPECLCCYANCPGSWGGIHWHMIQLHHLAQPKTLHKGLPSPTS